MDVDGVVADTANYVFDALDISQEERKKFKKWEFFADMDEADEKRGRELLKDPYFWETIPVMKGAKKGIEQLMRRGHRITWLTAPYKSCVEWTPVRIRWLRMHFGDIGPILVRKDKENVDGDVLIDDKPDNIRKWSDAHPLGHAILFQTPFNKDFMWYPRVTWSSMPRVLGAL